MSRLKLLPLLFLSACSPAYVARSAAGHAGLLWRQRSIAATIADPKTPPPLKHKLEIVVAARDFAYSRLALTRSRSYRKWTPVKGGAVTWLVSASPRTRLEAHRFWFPLIGSYPYKGHFRRDLAVAEAAELEAAGLDAAVGGAGAYKTGLIIPDPVPSTLLGYPDGELAETVIHELMHGTVWFRNQTDYDEAVAVWAGARGGELFLADKFGADSAEMKEWKDGKATDAKRDKLYGELRERLNALYGGPDSDGEKLERRKVIFDWARAEAKLRGLAPFREPLNNAVVLAHALYAPDLSPFDDVYEKNGRDWAKTIAALKAAGPPQK